MILKFNFLHVPDPKHMPTYIKKGTEYPTSVSMFLQHKPGTKEKDWSPLSKGQVCILSPPLQFGIPALCSSADGQIPSGKVQLLAVYFLYTFNIPKSPKTVLGY